MQVNEPRKNAPKNYLDEAVVIEALTALGRCINMASTYGSGHPAVRQGTESAHDSIKKLFTDRKKISLGAINGSLTVDGQPIPTTGVLLKSLERRLVRLEITGLRITRDLSVQELMRLAELLATSESGHFDNGLGSAGLAHISTEKTRYEAVQENETVANKADLAGAGGNGILVLEDDLGAEEGSGGKGDSDAEVHVDQIVAFLKGDLEHDDEGVDEELAEMATDPNRLGQMIMEAVSIRQKASELSGESLGDVVLGCLRRTFDGLRKKPAFQTKEGAADLQKALLLLEESMLDRMRDLTGTEDPELDRQIVQAIREMDETLGFEVAAHEYVEHQAAIEANKQQMQAFLQSRGTDSAEELIEGTGIPPSDWRRIVVASEQAGGSAHSPLPAGLNNLATVFEKLESLMKSDRADNSTMQTLLGQASENLDDTVDSTREKLEVLSRHLKEEDTGTIGGEALSMSRKELLSSIAEVAQELMQPLTAINASVEMMLDGYVGQVTNDQKDMLTLACNSGEHLKHLMKELIAIVGCPTNKGVDKRFHTTSEKVVLMQQ